MIRACDRWANVLVWMMDYEAWRVEVHTPDNLVRLYGESMMLTDGSILRGFELPVNDVFPRTKDARTGLHALRVNAKQGHKSVSLQR